MTTSTSRPSSAASHASRWPGRKPGKPNCSWSARSGPWRRATLAPHAAGAGGPSHGFDTGCEEVAYSPVVAELTAVLEPLYGARDREAGVAGHARDLRPRRSSSRPGGLWLDDASVLPRARRGRGVLRPPGRRLRGRCTSSRSDSWSAANRWPCWCGSRCAAGTAASADSRTLGHLWRFRDGKAIEIRAFNDPARRLRGSLTRGLSCGRPRAPRARTCRSRSRCARAGSRP